MAKRHRRQNERHSASRAYAKSASRLVKIAGRAYSWERVGPNVAAFGNRPAYQLTRVNLPMLERLVVPEIRTVVQRQRSVFKGTDAGREKQPDRRSSRTDPSKAGKREWSAGLRQKTEWEKKGAAATQRERQRASKEKRRTEPRRHAEHSPTARRDKAVRATCKERPEGAQHKKGGGGNSPPKFIPWCDEVRKRR